MNSVRNGVGVANGTICSRTHTYVYIHTCMYNSSVHFRRAMFCLSGPSVFVYYLDVRYRFEKKISALFQGIECGRATPIGSVEDKSYIVRNNIR